MYSLVDETDGFVEEKEGNKYLNVAFTDGNSEVLKKCAEVWSGITDQIRKINDGRSREYKKDCMKIKFDYDDNLPLNKILKFRILTIIIGNIFLKGW